MKVTDLTWPSPNDPLQIRNWYREGSRALIGARKGRTIHDWDMDMIGETLPAYIATIYVPGKLASSTRFIEPNYVTLYRMTAEDELEEVVDVPFFAPPIPREQVGPWIAQPAQELVGAMMAELKRLVDPLPRTMVDFFSLPFRRGDGITGKR